MLVPGNSHTPPPPRAACVPSNNPWARKQSKCATSSSRTQSRGAAQNTLHADISGQENPTSTAKAQRTHPKSGRCSGSSAQHRSSSSRQPGPAGKWVSMGAWRDLCVPIPCSAQAVLPGMLFQQQQDAGRQPVMPIVTWITHPAPLPPARPRCPAAAGVQPRLQGPQQITIIFLLLEAIRRAALSEARRQRRAHNLACRAAAESKNAVGLGDQ